MKHCPNCGSEIKEDEKFCRNCGHEQTMNVSTGRKKKCKYCMSEIDYKAKKCPHCGSKVKDNTLAIVILIITVPIFIIMYTSYLKEENSSPINNVRPYYNYDASKDLELVEHKLSNESNEFGAYIEGTIKSTRSEEISYIQIIFNTYDKDGNTIGTCMANNGGLEIYGTWKFKAICTNGVNEMYRYEFKEITAY